MKSLMGLLPPAPLHSREWLFAPDREWSEDSKKRFFFSEEMRVLTPHSLSKKTNFELRFWGWRALLRTAQRGGGLFEEITTPYFIRSTSLFVLCSVVF